MARYGREAHMARYGSSHGFQSIPGGNTCSVCGKEAREQAYACAQCSGTNLEKAIIVRRSIITADTHLHLQPSAPDVTLVTKISSIIQKGSSTNTLSKKSTYLPQYAKSQRLTSTKINLSDVVVVDPIFVSNFLDARTVWKRLIW